MKYDTHRAYLVIPKLIVQPTWGGSYISKYKQWQDRSNLKDTKIGQSYELFGGSNLSLYLTSADTQFQGELTDAETVGKITTPPNAVSLRELITDDSDAILGTAKRHYGASMQLLIKFTQALGNSFQLHVKDGTTDTFWRPKPESWYFFEPGSITLGVKKGINWEKYENAVTDLHEALLEISHQVTSGKLDKKIAEQSIQKLIAEKNPWQFVNVIDVPKNTIIDLTPCGIHHSWEEDEKLKYGNIVYELQLDLSDNSSTIRNFDKGKMKADGSVRSLHIEDYFHFIDRSGPANDPETHMRKPKVLEQTDTYTKLRMMESTYYTLDEIQFTKTGEFTEKIAAFRHIFVKSGQVQLRTGKYTLTITQGHSAFIPAGVESFTIKATHDTHVLVSFV